MALLALDEYSTEGYPLPLDIYSAGQEKIGKINKWKRPTKQYSRPATREALKHK